MVIPFTVPALGSRLGWVGLKKAGPGGGRYLRYCTKSGVEYRRVCSLLCCAVRSCTLMLMWVWRVNFISYSTSGDMCSSRVPSGGRGGAGWGGVEGERRVELLG